MEIINGTNKGEPIGFLDSLDGRKVPVWSKETLNEAIAEAIGLVPEPPEYGLGGTLTPIVGERGITSYAYDPSGDEKNKILLETYKQKIFLWNYRADKINKFAEVFR